MADLVVGAVLIPGAKAPRLIEEDDLKRMKPGSVIIDVAIDQGGCIATSRPTTHSEPTYIVARRAALLRDQHAGRRGPHQHLRPVQRDAAVGDSNRPTGHRSSGRDIAADRPRGQHACRQGDQPARWRKRLALPYADAFSIAYAAVIRLSRGCLHRAIDS